MKTIKIYLVIFFSIFGYFSNLYSQSKFIHKKTLTIVFPNHEEVGDTVDFSRIRIAGNLHQKGQIWINGNQKKVYPSLAFVDLVKLEPGNNKIEIIGETEELKDTLQIKLFRKLPKEKIPQQPTIITNDLIFPDANIEFYEPSELRLQFRGSPGGNAEARISGLEKHIPMVELRPGKANGLRGVYVGIYKIPAVKKKLTKNIEFRLKGIDGKTAKYKTDSKITIYPSTLFLLSETIGKEALVYSRPGGSILLSLPAGVKLNLTAKYDNYYQVKISSDLVGYIRANSFRLLAPGTTPPRANIGNIRIWEDSSWTYVDVSVSEDCSFQVEQSINPKKLLLTIFQAAQTSEWMSYPDTNEHLELVNWRQPTTDRYELEVTLNQDHWGYKANYLDQILRLSIRKQPVIDDNLFRNVIFAVDAGHGGEELGAVGATGLLEKNVNLIYATYLCKMLQEAGAKAFLTRNIDTTMTLRSRVELAEKKGVHIFIWCHNNSIGAATNPLRVKGTSTYFTHPMGKRLADLTLPHLLNLGLKNFGKIQRTYYVTRQTQMIVFLVEGAFISNPEDEMLLMDNEFLHKLAKAVFDGIKDFLEEKQEQIQIK